jgi:simple sugar transport system ATP-binding protein
MTTAATDPRLTPPAIAATGIWKSFGAVQANRGASLEVLPGEIHAVVGENGAGKSTLMRVLAGLYPPDAGEVRLRGSVVTGWSTREAIAAGVGMVHQHFMLAPTLTVAENLVLGQEPTQGVRLDLTMADATVRDLCTRTGLVADPTRRVADLSVGEAQRVEILKIIYRGARLLILDEPTAVLSPPEVLELWKVLRTLVATGGTVVLITHKLDEVVAVSDRVTVMRAGETVGCVRTGDVTPTDLARLMVGRDVRLATHETQPKVATAPPAGPARPVALVVHDLTVPSSRRPNEVDGVSLELRAGEIFGLAGVEGNGQTELIEAVAGLRHPSTGVVRLGDLDITHRSVGERSRAGISHIPEDRHRRGLILDYSVAANLILGLLDRFSRPGRLRRDDIDANARDCITQFDIRPADAALPARALSGGNQQKVVIAREMRGREFSVLLAVQPTRGVDVGAIEFIHDQLRAARDRGKAVFLVSADLVEILALSDRVGVMYGGRLVVTLPRAEASPEILGPYMMGVRAGAAA